MKKIFVCSPLRGDIAGNIEKAKGYCRSIAKMGMIPIAPHVYFTQFLDDENPDERKMGMAMGNELLVDCDELWMFGEMSQGMLYEDQIAFLYNIKRRNGFEMLKEDRDG